MYLRSGIALLLAAAALGGLAAPAQAAQLSRDASLEAGLLVEINKLRSRHGLATLRHSTPLAAAATGHTRAMAEHGFFRHESRDGTAFWKRVERSYRERGFGFWAVGENLAWSTDLDAAGAVQMWLASPQHRKVLLSPRWREVGFGAVRAAAASDAFGGLDVTIVTADFGVRR